ncbi:unnamed protein product [Tilletia controversa]|uniref:Uncharacterized protein n=3 Tax=Tilletia TaxID=13289 RepID=A0A9N8QMW9_9BASI|nr:hypothetical protein CF336_g8889 [Tilletia laevis]KAE8243282.1 hypothetical protein A4X03_0g7808 [Tilletia caries]CAD6925230.1 unnamed protein product [Tilletia controversa]KAE8182546.1 hypothetical protein CF335_g8597 [Tilletia laevis]CAD6890329.1 unnamed protein product [Tilletia caries]
MTRSQVDACFTKAAAEALLKSSTKGRFRLELADTAALQAPVLAVFPCAVKDKTLTKEERKEKRRTKQPAKSAARSAFSKESDGPVWLSLALGPMTADQSFEYLKRMQQDFGWSKLTTLMFRRAFATFWMTRISEHQLRALMGHSRFSILAATT